MDFLDIIGKVIEFSEKGEEYSDEIKAFRATLESLQLTVQNIEPEDMPTHLSGMLSDNLQEAKELLNKAGNQNSTWLTNIRNMLPGSQLQKIKEKNQQLVHIITLINLHLNSNVKGGKRGLDTSSTANYDDEEPTKLKRMHTYSTSSTTPKNASMQKKSQSDTKFDILGPTLEANEDEESALEGPTQADGDGEEYTGGDEGHAFRLRVLYDERLGKALKGCKDFVPIIEKTWEGSNNAEYIFQRVNYAYLPMEDVKRLSRDHAVINAIRGVATNGKEEDYTVTATVPDDDKLYGATIQDDGEEEKTNGNVGGDGVKFVLKDLSLNGTHYLKSDKLLNFPPGGMKINGEFKLLKKNEEAVLENGDIIGLIMQKPYCKDLIFGFQLLTE